MSTEKIKIPQMIDRIDAAWSDIQTSVDGMPDEEMLIPGVTGEWSVRDILAHVAVWDAYALGALPGILETGKHPDNEEDVDPSTHA